MATTNTYPATPSIHKGRPITEQTVGSIPSTTGLFVEEFGGPYPARTTKVTFTSFPITITRTSSSVAGNSGATQTGLFYTFPVGYIWLKGGVIDVTLAAVTMADTSGAVTGVGTTQNTGTPASLATTEQSLIASATTAIASSAGSRTAASPATYIAPVDGRTTAAGLYFNFGTADDITASGTIYVTGYIKFSWENLGDT